MKKLILMFVAMFGFGMAMNAQADKDLKSAQKSLSKFYQNGDANELVGSVDLLASAFESDEIKSNCGAWISRGKIYGELANSEFKLKTLDPTYKIMHADAAIEAYTSFKNANELCEKKGDKKDVLAGLTEAENHLNNAAIFTYQEKDYASAFKNFNTSLGASELLKSIGGTSRLDEEGLLNDQYFFAAASGYYAQMYPDVKPLFEKLMEMNSDEALVYEGMYNIAKTEGDDDAARYLSMGRERFPDDTGLLFQEINHYLVTGQLEVLISKLELAIEKEPENISVHVTLGNVYDQLAVKASGEGDLEKSTEYFEKALQKYKDGLAIDDSDFNATYSIGAMYYNQAAAMVDDLNDLASDLSPKGMQNYDKKKEEMDAAFQAALPYFEKAESLKSDDLNTVIALKEIHARLNNIEKSNSYKVKYESLTGAGN